jgi:hypothetical protein
MPGRPANHSSSLQHVGLWDVQYAS